MKKIPRITINRIELCKQPKSGAFRTAILTPFHRMSSVFGFDSPAAKNIQQIVYKMYGSHYEDLNARHYLCCQTHLSQLFVMSGGASLSWKGGDRDFLNCKKVMRLLFSFSLSLPFFLPLFLLSYFPFPFFLFCFLIYQRQPDMYLLLKCTNLLRKQQETPVSCCIFIWASRREETWAGDG